MSDFKNILNFLTKLAENNNRDWFNYNKSEFEKARDEFIEFVSYVISQIEHFDTEIVGVDPKKSMIAFTGIRDLAKTKHRIKLILGPISAKEAEQVGTRAIMCMLNREVTP